MNILTSLGSMGWIPTGNRHTCCYCLEISGCDKLIIFDAGTGLARFDEPWGREILDRYHSVLFILSHYHMDHVAGLIYFSFFFKEKKVEIAAPGIDIYGRPAAQILDDFMKPPFGRKLSDAPFIREIHDLGRGDHTISGLSIKTGVQAHSEPSLGITVNNSVAYITDTPCSEETVQLVSGCRLLLHESWLDNQDPEIKTESFHSNVNGVAELAQKAAVEELLLIHLNPGYDESRLIAMETDARRIFPNTKLARDGGSIYIK